MTSNFRYFKAAALDDPGTTVRSEPFPFLIAKDILPESERRTLAADFPRFTEAGYLPHEADKCGASINALIAEATSPEVADKLGRKLGIEKLSQFPSLVTISAALNHRHGNIHTDGKSKVATALIYLNETWGDTSGGCFRFLTSEKDINATVVPEMKPVYGNFAIFKRTDNSYHGHLPWEGERRVIQIAWIVSEEEKNRKSRDGKLARFFKKLLGGFDKKVGADRSREAKKMD